VPEYPNGSSNSCKTTYVEASEPNASGTSLVIDCTAPETAPVAASTEAMTTQSQTVSAGPTTASELTKQSQALDSNASSESQSLISDTAALAEYVNQVEPTKSVEWKVEGVEPLTRDALGTPSVTMDNLHQMSEDELDILETLCAFGKVARANQ
jgi:hypothetical protein